MRIFESSGLVNPKSAYYIELGNVTNTNDQDMKTMVDHGRYFSIFAPRQSGKTTFLTAFCHQLHQDKKYMAIILSFQKYKELNKKEFYFQVEKHLYRQLKRRLTDVDCNKLTEICSFLDNHRLTSHISFSDLIEKLNEMIEYKKLVIFIDEFDGIPREELENFLSTLRDLYQQYKDEDKKALYSVGLIGIRNITKLIVGGVSPFNIADQVTLPTFSLEDIHHLYSQYTTETGQPFIESAVNKVYEVTSGQPWLVNRLAAILTVDIKPRTLTSIDSQDVEKAVEILLKERNVHFDNLDEKARLYKETLVEIIFDHVEYNPFEEDQTSLEQFGLIKNREGHAVVSNNIYKGRYLKAFFKEVRAYEEKTVQPYELPGHRLDMNRILLNFGSYIAQIGVGAFYKEKKPYEKTGQFLLTAWLYQFVRGERGQLGYEVRSGLGRMDIILAYKGKKYIIETKMNRHGNVSGIMQEGLEQLSTRYLATEGEGEGYLVIFDTGTMVGTPCKTQVHETGDKTICSLIIGVGRPIH